VEIVNDNIPPRQSNQKVLSDADFSDDASDTSSPPTPKAPSSPRRIAIVGASPTLRPDLYFRAPAFTPVVAPPPLRETPLDPWVMYYDCAFGCPEPIKIRQGEPLRCKECGKWMLYKRRTKRICYFEAR
jgi:DNA-directed RNA polymerase subunit RPC12/RpoP